jgi:PKHD-type hydroxylase
MLYHIKESIVPISFCDEVIKQGENKEISKAKIQEGNKANRSSDVSWLDEEKLGTSLTNLVIIANRESGWNYSLKEFEPLQYTIYKEDDFYDWHIDSHNIPYDNGMVRKLSFTLCLNEDYEGGSFSFCSPHPISKKTKIETLDKPKKGTMIVFPSYTWHKVDKVTSGVRKTLVGWVVGKEWS